MFILNHIQDGHTALYPSLHKVQQHDFRRRIEIHQHSDGRNCEPLWRRLSSLRVQYRHAQGWSPRCARLRCYVFPYSLSGARRPLQSLDWHAVVRSRSQRDTGQTTASINALTCRPGRALPLLGRQQVEHSADIRHKTVPMRVAGVTTSTASTRRQAFSLQWTTTGTLYFRIQSRTEGIDLKPPALARLGYLPTLPTEERESGFDNYAAVRPSLPRAAEYDSGRQCLHPGVMASATPANPLEHSRPCA